MQENAKKGKVIGERLRDLLFNVDLKIVYAKGQKNVATQDFELYQKIKNPKANQRAMEAKIRRECFSNYANNLLEIKKDIHSNIDFILNTYTPKHKEIWKMYFLQRASIDDISNKVGYSRENVLKIINKLKSDLCSNFEDFKK